MLDIFFEIRLNFEISNPRKVQVQDVETGGTGYTIHSRS